MIARIAQGGGSDASKSLIEQMRTLRRETLEELVALRERGERHRRREG